MPFNLVLARWDLRLLKGSFPLYALQFSLWELIKPQHYQKPQAGFYLLILSTLLCSRFPVWCSSPPPCPCHREITMVPCIYPRTLTSVSRGLFYCSSLDPLLGFLIYTYEARPPTSPLTQASSPTDSWRRHLLRKGADRAYSNLKLAGRKDTGAWLRPIQLLYWRQSKESNDTLLWKLSRNVKNAFALFFFCCCCCCRLRCGHQGQGSESENKAE